MSLKIKAKAECRQGTGSLGEAIHLIARKPGVDPTRLKTLSDSPSVRCNCSTVEACLSPSADILSSP
jgi:hypothetical protein